MRYTKVLLLRLELVKQIVSIRNVICAILDRARFCRTRSRGLSRRCGRSSCGLNRNSGRYRQASCRGSCCSRCSSSDNHRLRCCGGSRSHYPSRCRCSSSGLNSYIRRCSQTSRCRCSSSGHYPSRCRCSSSGHYPSRCRCSSSYWSNSLNNACVWISIVVQRNGCCRRSRSHQSSCRGSCGRGGRRLLHTLRIAVLQHPTDVTDRYTTLQQLIRRDCVFIKPSNFLLRRKTVPVKRQHARQVPIHTIRIVLIPANSGVTTQRKLPNLPTLGHGPWFLLRTRLTTHKLKRINRLTAVILLQYLRPSWPTTLITKHRRHRLTDLRHDLVLRVRIHHVIQRQRRLITRR